MNTTLTTLAQIDSGFIAFVLFMLGFGFLIFIHEMGHFLAAKFVGIRATQFAIGFGQALFAYRSGMGFRIGTTENDYFTRLHELYDKHHQEDPEKYPARNPKEPLNDLILEKLGDELELGETEYRLNWIPFGGYVKMVGQEDMDPTATSDNPRAFNQKPFGPRSLVICAGVVMNAICAAIFFLLAFMEGVYFPPAKVGMIMPNSPAATTPAEGHPDRFLQIGDQVVEINGKRNEGPNKLDFTDVRIAAALDAKQAENPKLGEPIDLVVQSPDEQGAEYRYRLTPTKGPGQPFFSLGLGMPQNLWIGALSHDFKMHMGIHVDEAALANLAKDEKANRDAIRQSLAPILKRHPSADTTDEQNNPNPDGYLDHAEFVQFKTNVLSKMRLAMANGQALHPNDHWQFDKILQQNGPKPLHLTFVADMDAYKKSRDANDGRAPETFTAEKSAPSISVDLQPFTELSVLDITRDGDKNTKLIQHLLGLVPPVRIDHVVPNSPAAGHLMEGDIIAELNGVKYPNWSHIVDTILDSRGKDLNFKVHRDQTSGDLVEVVVQAKPRGVLGMGKPKLGISSQIAEDTNRIAHIRDDSPFAKLKTDGSLRILKINDRSITRFTDIRLAIMASDGTLEVEYQIQLAGDRNESATIKISDEQKAEVAALRWDADLPSFQPRTELQDAGGNAWVAVRMGLHKTHLFMMQTYLTLARLFQGTVGLDQMKGPVGITDIGYQITKKGIPYLLFMLALISINLAVINFLPLPIVDGGLFVLLVIETVRGKPVPAKIAQAINLVGLILIGTIFLYITYNDIAGILTR